MKYGYVRETVNDPKGELQQTNLTSYCCDKVYKEIGSNSNEKPELNKLLSVLSPGDTLIVYRLDIISEDIRGVIHLLEGLSKSNVEFISVNDDISSLGEYSLYTIVDALILLEKNTRSEKIKLGMKKSRARGRKGGRPKLDLSNIDKAIRMYDSREYSIDEIIKATKVSQATLYRRIKERDQ